MSDLKKRWWISKWVTTTVSILTYICVAGGIFVGVALTVGSDEHALGFWKQVYDYLGSSYTPTLSFILPCAAWLLEKLHGCIIRRRESRELLEANVTIRSFCIEILQEHLHLILKKLPVDTGFTVHDLKVTLYVPIAGKLVSLARAGGIHKSACTHEFNMEGDNQGIAGLAYSSRDIKIADGLPDLHAQQSTTDRKKSIATYAQQTATTQDYVKTELKHKNSKQRRMPRTLIGLAISAPDNHTRVLGVVVVDCVAASLVLPYDIFASLVEALRIPLDRMPHEKKS